MTKDKEKTLKYEPPKVLSLSRNNPGVGGDSACHAGPTASNCRGGSQAHGNCTYGSTALGANCTGGGAVKSECYHGLDAGSTCVDGHVAAGQCNAGGAK